MEAMGRPDWTDSRLEDLNDKVDRIDVRVDALSRRMDERFDAQQHEMNSRFDGQRHEINTRFDAQRREMVSQFDAMNGRFDSFQRAMFQAAVALSVSILTAGAAIVATQIWVATLPAATIVEWLPVTADPLFAEYGVEVVWE